MVSEPGAAISVVEPELFGGDAADDLLGIGLAASDLEQGGAAQVEESLLDGLLADLAGRFDSRR